MIRMFLSLCTKNNCSMIHRTVGTEHCMSNTEQHWEPIRSNRRDTQCDKHFPNKNVPTNTKCSLWESANTPYKELCIPHKCVWPSRALCPKDNRLPEHIDCLPHRGTLRWAQCLCTLSNCLQRHRTTDTLDDTANTFWHFLQIRRNWWGTQCDTRCSENKCQFDRKYSYLRSKSMSNKGKHRPYIDDWFNLGMFPLDNWLPTRTRNRLPLSMTIVAQFQCMLNSYQAMCHTTCIWDRNLDTIYQLFIRSNFEGIHYGRDCSTDTAHQYILCNCSHWKSMFCKGRHMGCIGRLGLSIR